MDPLRRIRPADGVARPAHRREHEGGLPVDKVVGNWICAGLAIFLSGAALTLAYDAVLALMRPAGELKTAKA